jgi:hypothetical protein
VCVRYHAGRGTAEMEQLAKIIMVVQAVTESHLAGVVAYVFSRLGSILHHLGAFG